MRTVEQLPQQKGFHHPPHLSPLLWQFLGQVTCTPFPGCQATLIFYQKTGMSNGLDILP